MVMSSAQIAQLNGAFQNNTMMNMAHAGMISPATMGESVMGGAVGTAGAIGSPLAMGGLALAGLDPVSIALRGGMAARGAGMGFMGMAGAGALAGGAAFGGIGAASYGVEQMYQGAQQQQMLQQSLRQNYQFRNQFGGVGFTRGEVGGIGSMMRQMTTDQGPGGEMVGFEELGRLANNMARMGMAQGVRNARDFSERFKQMVSTLKDIASEMGTSLEEAQKMMAGMKSSGIFRASDAARFAGMIRQGAEAGGLATPELTGMMNVGSQISRMVGGRGIAGARAGLETITNIGVAQQLGTINEEDIYNATGLTGAEGRRALATTQLQGAAGFLRRGRGRRFLAAMAGRNGQLDESDVEAFMSGGVGTGETMQRAHENLRGVGRANFIRNEGRLRGEVMSRFGGLVQAAAYKSWLEERGINVNTEDDRAMLFLQRQERMGRDEADVMVKMMRDLPRLMRERQTAAEDTRFARRTESLRKGQGIEGIKRKFEQARADVQAGLQQIGADFMREGSDAVDRFVNQVTGDYVRTHRSDVTRAMREAQGGGAAGAAALRNTFGIGGGISAAFRGEMSDAFGQVGTVEGAERFNREFAKRDAARLREAGYDVGVGEDLTLAQRTDVMGTARQIQQGLRAARAIERAAGGPGADVGGVGGKLKDRLRDAYNRGDVKGMGRDRLRSAAQAIERAARDGDPDAKRISEQLKGATTDEERMRIVAGVNRAIGQTGESSMYRVPDTTGVYSTKQALTLDQESEKLGEALLGVSGVREESGIFAWYKRLGNKIAGGGIWEVGMESGVMRSAGEFIKSDEGRRLVAMTVGADREAQDRAKEMTQDRLRTLSQRQQRGELTTAERGEMHVLRTMRAAQKYDAAVKRGASEQELQKIAREEGMDLPSLKKAASTIGAVARGGFAEARTQAAEQMGRTGREAMAGFERGGLLKAKQGGGVELAAEVQAGLAEADTSGGAVEFVKAMVDQQRAMAEGTEGMGADAAEALLSRQAGFGASARKALTGLSVTQMRQAAKALQGRGAGGIREELLSQARVQQGLEGRRGQEFLIGELGLGKEAFQAMRGEETEGGAAAALSEHLGGIGKEELTSIIGGLRKGGQQGDVAAQLRDFVSSEEFQQMKKLQAQKKDDPLQSQMSDGIKRIADASDEQTKFLRTISNNTRKEDFWSSIGGGAEDNK